MNFLYKLGEQEQSEYERLQEAISELSQEQLDDFQRSAVETPRLDKLATGMQTADRMGRELAREHGEKLMKQAAWQAGVAKFLNKSVKPLAHRGLNMAAKNPSAALAAGGAGVGAIGGAITGGGVDPATGQKKSRLGAMAVGAGLGAGAGYGLSKIPGVGKSISSAAAGAHKNVTQLGQKATGWGNKAVAAEGAAAKAAPAVAGAAEAAPAAAKGPGLMGRIKGMFSKAPAAGGAPAAAAGAPAAAAGQASSFAGQAPNYASLPGKAPAGPKAGVGARMKRALGRKAPTGGGDIATSGAFGPETSNFVPHVAGPGGKKKFASMTPVERMKVVVSARR
jgi:hypothetical protein